MTRVTGARAGTSLRVVRLRVASLRPLAVALAAGTVVAALVGGTAARGGMRLVLVADGSTRGFETAAGATIGEFTAAGTVVLYFLSLAAGAGLCLAYWAGRPFLPAQHGLRVAIATLAVTLLGTGLIAGNARTDFAFVPQAVSVVLIAAGVALTVLPVTMVLERLLPTPRRRLPGWVSVPVVLAFLVAVAVFAALRVAEALDQTSVV